MINRRHFLKNSATAVAAAALGVGSAPRSAPAAAPVRETPWTQAELQRFGIWDVHGHVNTPGRTPSERMENLVRVADRMGVERLCICMSAPWAYHPTPEQFRKSNDDVLAILRDWGSRAFGFVYLNPAHLRESLDELERCVADGPMVGIKLWVGMKCSRPELDPIIARAAELKAVVLQHTWIKRRGTGNLEAESMPSDLVTLSARHPGVPLICGHLGGEWIWGTRTIRERPELYADLGGGDPVSGQVEMAVRELGAHRILYGSDISGRSFGSQIGKVLGADISLADKRLIFRDNLRNLMLPILQRKGISA